MDSRKLMLVAVLVPLAVGAILGSSAKPPEEIIQWQTVTEVVRNIVTARVTQTITHAITTTSTINAAVTQAGTQPAEKLVLVRLYPCQYPQDSIYFTIYCKSTESGILQTYQWVSDKQGNLYLKFTLRNVGSVPVTVISIDIGERIGSSEQSGQGGSTSRDILSPGYALEYSFPNDICNLDYHLPIKICPHDVDWWLKAVSEKGTVFTFQIGPIPASVPIIP